MLDNASDHHASDDLAYNLNTWGETRTGMAPAFPITDHEPGTPAPAPQAMAVDHGKPLTDTPGQSIADSIQFHPTARMRKRPRVKAAAKKRSR